MGLYETAKQGVTYNKTVIIKSEADFPAINGFGQHPLEEGVNYRIDGDVTCINNFLLPASGFVGIYGDTVSTILEYIGGGDMFVQSGHQGGGVSIFDLGMKGNNTATWMNIIETGNPVEIVWSRCNVEDFLSLGTLNVSSIAGDFTSHINYANPLDCTVKSDFYMAGSIFYSGLGSDGIILRMEPNAIAQIVGNTQFKEIGESFLEIPSTLNDFRMFIDGNLNTPDAGELFNPSGLDNTDPRISVSGNVGYPDSDTIGSLVWDRNTVETPITVTGKDGSITSFANAGGGQVTVTTSVAHNLTNGEFVSISNNSRYDGYYQISNVTANTFRITATFVATGTGLFSSGWVKILGTTYAAVNERCSMTANNKLTFTNLAPHRGVGTISLTVLRGSSGAATPTFTFTIFKNGKPNLLSGREVRSSNDTNNVDPRVISFSPPIICTKGDYFELYCRNITNTSSVLVTDGQVTLT